MTGRMIAVVGPSGVGKDSVMAGLSAARPGLHVVRRAITRAPGLGGEDYDAVTVAEFKARAARGDFAVHWGAHGLFYGIPAQTVALCNSGTDCLANFSRSALARAAEVYGRFTVLNLTARPETLAARLTARGRESAEDIAARLAKAERPLPADLHTLHIANDGQLAETVAAAAAALATNDDPCEVTP